MVIKEVWCAAVGEELSCMREVENSVSRSVHCSSCKIGSNRRSHSKLGNIAARHLERAQQRHCHRRNLTTTNWCEVNQLSDWSSSMAITMATPLLLHYFFWTTPFNTMYSFDTNKRGTTVTTVPKDWVKIVSQIYLLSFCPKPLPHWHHTGPFKRGFTLSTTNMSISCN